MRRGVHTLLRDHDVLLPSGTSTAFTHPPTGAPVEVDGTEASYWERGKQLAFCNLLGLPALSVPAGFDDDGLPIGVQLVGSRWSEMRLLDIARAMEHAAILPGFRAPPIG